MAKTATDKTLEKILPEEIIVNEIIPRLSSSDAGQLALVNKTLCAYATEAYWQAKFKQHFPYLPLNKASDETWRAAFHKASAASCPGLEPYVKRLFYLTKEGDLKGLKHHIKECKISFSDLQATDGKLQLIFYARKNQSILDLFYTDIVSVEYQNDSFQKTIDCNKTLYSCRIIHLAAYFNQSEEIFDILVLNGAIYNDVAYDGITPAYLAATNGHIEALRILLNKGVDCNSAAADGTTLVCIAAQLGHTAILRLLLDKGANYNAARNDGATPITMAVEKGHFAVVQLLLSKGADCNAALNDGATLVYLAAQNGHTAILRLLLDKGANYNAARNDGTTPIFTAANNGHFAAFCLLLDKGADYNAARNDGWSLIFIAAHKGYAEVLRRLLNKDADCNAARNNGATLVYLAAQNGHAEVLSILLNKGANYNTARNDGTTPVFTAAQNGHTAVLSLLLDRGANFDITLNDGATPIFIATQNGHTAAVRLLLDKGANYNIEPADGISVVFIAAYYNHLSIIDLLLTYPNLALTPYRISTDEINRLVAPKNLAIKRRAAEFIKLRSTPTLDKIPVYPHEIASICCHREVEAKLCKYWNIRPLSYIPEPNIEANSVGRSDAAAVRGSGVLVYGTFRSCADGTNNSLGVARINP